MEPSYPVHPCPRDAVVTRQRDAFMLIVELEGDLCLWVWAVKFFHGFRGRDAESLPLSIGGRGSLLQGLQSVERTE